MTKIFSLIDEWVPQQPGWCTPENAKIFASVVYALRPETVVEIGVYGGRSLISMALVLKELGSGTIYGVDPWSAKASVEGQQGEHKTWWGNLNHDEIFKHFEDSVNKVGVRNCVKTIRLTSDEWDPPKNIDILNIDGNHGIQAIRDVNRYAVNVRVGGICFMDDLDWPGGAVMKGVERLKTIGFQKLYDAGTTTVFQRMSR